jgi:hypothetical protein
MCTVSPENRLLDIDDVALKLGTTPLNVLLYLKRGQLKGEEIEGKWFIESQSLESLMSGPDKVGSAPCKSSCGRSGGCSGCH